MNEVENIYNGTIKFLSLNTDDEQELAAMFKISAIPAILFMRDGKVSATLTGIRSKKEVVERAEELLK